MNADKFHPVIEKIEGWTLIEEWRSEDVRSGNLVNGITR